MEKKLIEAKFRNSKIFTILIGVGCFFILFSILWAYRIYRTGESLYYTEFFPNDIIYDTFYEFLKAKFVANGYVNFIYCGVFIIICSLFARWLMCHCSLTITNRRVVGKASFGKAVDLPLNQISAIGLGFFDRISIGTSSGRIHFWLLENRQEIHALLSDLIGKIQGEASSPQTAPQASSSADEIKKFKELLDSGVITQEEFDAKKKQLLGL